ncbi:MAG: phage baseplate assembly protein V [Paracoccaceae bacterium]
MTQADGKFYGKHRGKVEVNLDPLGLGRVQVSVADVMGDGTLAWAMPCLPGAGPKVGLFVIPPVGANVWVEFERGDPDYPIWSGGFWDTGDTPATMGPTQAVTRVWAGENFRLEVLDAQGMGELTLSVTTATGDAVLKAGADAMELSFAGATVKLAADGVTVNDGNLKVLP